MAASINDKFTEATNGSRPVATTLTAILPSGASPGTATCGALTGWPTATAVHFIIYTIDVNGRKVSGSQTDWKGIVSGLTITNLTLKAGTNNGYSIGAVVEAAPTAAWADDVTEGIAVQHNQDGTHKSVTTDTLTASGAVQGASLIATGDIQHRSISLETIRSELLKDFVASGCVWSGDSYGSTRAASMTAGVVYVGGKRVAVSSVSARTFTASKDTYVDVDNAGTLTYTEANNNAASPALAAGSLRLAIIVTGAGSIADAGSVNQGESTKVLPIASSIPYATVDSIGNRICRRSAFDKRLGFRKKTSTGTVITTSYATYLTLTVIGTGREVEIEYGVNVVDGISGAIRNADVKVQMDGADVTGSELDVSTNVSNGGNNTSFIATNVPSAGAHTFTLQLISNTSSSQFLHVAYLKVTEV